mgnify:CR=1 FL=1
MPLVGNNWVGPLPGRYFNYALPILKDRTASTTGTAKDPVSLQGIFRCEEVYCKQPIGQFLELQRYPPRTGVFDPNGNNANRGRLFAIRGGKGAQQYKLILRQDTDLTIYVPTPGTNQGELKLIYPKSISISVPRTVKVQEIRQWLLTGLAQTDGTIEPNLQQEWFQNIVAFITPTQVTYNLYESYGDISPAPVIESVNNPNLPEDAEASPTPSP